jgi:hypothetical protein
MPCNKGCHLLGCIQPCSRHMSGIERMSMWACFATCSSRCTCDQARRATGSCCNARNSGNGCQLQLPQTASALPMNSYEAVLLHVLHTNFVLSQLTDCSVALFLRQQSAAKAWQPVSLLRSLLPLLLAVCSCAALMPPHSRRAKPPTTAVPWQARSTGSPTQPLHLTWSAACELPNNVRQFLPVSSVSKS